MKPSMPEDQSTKPASRHRQYPLLTVLVFVGYTILWALFTFLLDRYWLVPHDPHDGLHLAVNGAFALLMAITLYGVVRWAQRRDALAADDLAASETRYRQLFFDTFAILLLIDPISGQIVDANPAACTFYGYSHADLTSRNLTDLDTTPSDFLRERAMATRPQNRLLETQHQLASGQVRSVEIFATPIHIDGQVRIYAIVHDVTARRQAEAALRQSEQRFSNMFEYSTVGMAVVDLEGKFQEVNPALAAFLGYKVPELRGVPVDTVTHPDDREREHTLAYQVIAGETSGFTIEKRYIRKDGSVVWGRLVSTVMLGGYQSASVFGMVQDITTERQQRRLVETLRDVGSLLTSRLSLDEVLDRILDLLAAVVDYDSASIQLIDETGSLQLMRGRGFPDLEESTEIAQRVLDETMETRWRDSDVLVLPDTHNDDRWIATANEYIRSWIGVALRVRGVLIGVLNVDCATPNAYDAVIADTVLAFANQAAIALENARLYAGSQERNDRLLVLNRITRSGTALTDLDELTVEIANIAPQVIGADRCLITLWDEQRGLPYPVAATGDLHERYRRVHVEPGERSLTDRVLTEGQPIVAERGEVGDLMSPALQERFEYDITTRSLVALPMQIGQRRIGALMLVFDAPHTFTDDEITWALQVAEVSALAIARAQVYSELEARVEIRTAELSAANAQLVALSEIKDEFVANVSHELRTPVASIKLYHHLLTVRPDKRDDYLNRLDIETRRLERIIEDLLYLSRMDRGEADTDPLPLNLNELVGMYVIDRHSQAQERGLSLAFQPAKDLPAIYGDNLSLGRMLGALIGNALSYTPAGGHITVSTGLRTPQGKQQVTLTVEDDGPGVPEEEQPHIFDRFYRGQVGRDSGVPGTGLGLAISKEIAERHGGGIVVLSPVSGDKGTRFVVWLPVDGAESRPGVS